MKNVVDKYLTAYGRLSIKYLVKENLDVIVIADFSTIYTVYLKNSTDRLREFLERIEHDPVLSKIKAVREGHVFIVDYQLVLNVRSIIGAFYLAKALYPKLFKDIDPDKLHEEFFEKWFGIPYRGIWFYPEPWKTNATLS